MWVLTATWIVVVVGFWGWFIAPEQRGSSTMFFVNALPMAYITTVLPSFYWFFLARARIPGPHAARPGMKVAVITLCVPSVESLDVVERQLLAFSALQYPCDAWILDEGASPEIEALAARHGVHYFTRRGVERWNQTAAPFKAKTKAGNVNAWIDHVAALGLDYEVFAQFDIDHRPVPAYLDEILGYFDDPTVGWVQSPSVSGNLEHWTARGQAEQETVLQGPLQMGFYGHSSTPFIIGSHTGYRMAAIREIGGYQPTRAEDHLDTVVLAAHGYRGVYMPQVIATGDGPTTFSTYLGQQFAWAYSMVQILFLHTPRLLRHYHPAQAFQFLMAQSWYALWSVSCMLLWALPLVALITGERISTTRLSDFGLHYGSLLACTMLMWWWSRSLFRPKGVLLSWRALVLDAARWPIVLWAIVNVLFRVQRPYMITPKGKGETTVPGGRLYAPYFLLSWGAAATMFAYLAIDEVTDTAGYLWLAIFNSIAPLLVVIVASSLEFSEIKAEHGIATALRARGGTLVAVLATVAALGFLIGIASPLLRLTAS